ncbi:glycosyltransferase [Sphingomonas turrisvirgatae]|uniref:Glycosyl transferase family 2 n=1 Tax=Sphingomonas turrisvirgatae TaxID=1888892 RepID=A0A1E3LRU7_9SPHN|nr:glycosyltransferase [Sphingomonas turrisvirgatae]ODP36481.1 glycosyl transferase family 2 [Sphingomonas turrisvirgatae]
MPRISVIVPHYDDLKRLDRCLAALTAQSMPASDFEIVVADNMSPIGREAVERVIAGRARLVLAADKGAGPARNAGVAASSGALLAFTDADCVPERDWLAEGIQALDDCDFAGGRMVVIAEHDGPRSGAEAFETVFAFDNESYVRDKGFTVTANLFCSRAVFDRVGPFQVGVSEDYDWCLRARAAGFRIGYAERAVAGHPPRADWAALRKKWQRLNAEMFELALQKRGGRLKWLAHTLALPLSVAAHAPCVLRSPALADRGERARGLATLARLRFWRFTDGLSLAAGIRR